MQQNCKLDDVFVSNEIILSVCSDETYLNLMENESEELGTSNRTL